MTCAQVFVPLARWQQTDPGPSVPREDANEREQADDGRRAYDRHKRRDPRRESSASACSSAAEPDDRPGSCHARPESSGRSEWWRSLDRDREDPITLQPLVTMSFAPFNLHTDEEQKVRPFPACYVAICTPTRARAHTHKQHALVCAHTQEQHALVCAHRLRVTSTGLHWRTT